MFEAKPAKSLIPYAFFDSEWKPDSEALSLCETAPVLSSVRTPTSPVRTLSSRVLSKRVMVALPPTSVTVGEEMMLNSSPLRMPSAAQAVAPPGRSTSPRRVPKVSRSPE